MAKAPRSELKSTGYEIFVGLLSILSIVNLVLVYAVKDDDLDTVLAVMNGIFSVIFFADFLYRILTAPSWTTYFFRHFGWADLLASLPFPQFKILRVFRLIRVYRLLRHIGIRTVGRTLVRDRAGSALLILLLMGILVLQFGSLAMLAIEKDSEGANITSASDAIWYSLVTISTVGYGDQYPVTDIGRIGGALIIVIGVGIFGTFTGYLANLFLGSKTDDEPVAEEDASSADVASDSRVFAGTTVPDGGAEVEQDAATASAPDLDEVRALIATTEANLAAMKRLLEARPPR